MNHRTADYANTPLPHPMKWHDHRYDHGCTGTSQNPYLRGIIIHLYVAGIDATGNRNYGYDDHKQVLGKTIHILHNFYSYLKNRTKNAGLVRKITGVIIFRHEK